MIDDDTMYIYKAKVVSIYDGDSMRVDIDLGFKVSLSNQRVRLLGIDTPELRGEEREQGLIVRDYVRSLLNGEEVILKSYKDKYGKYGRWLVEVFMFDPTEEGGLLNVNQHLIDKGLALPYGV